MGELQGRTDHHRTRAGGRDSWWTAKSNTVSVRLDWRRNTTCECPEGNISAACAMLGVRVGNTSDLISSPFQTAFKGVSMRLAATLLALAAMSLPGAAVAQNAASSGPSFDGTLAIIRLSEITPEGSVDKFKAAVAAHQAWYASHGYKDIIFESPVLVPTPRPKNLWSPIRRRLRTTTTVQPLRQSRPTMQVGTHMSSCIGVRRVSKIPI
jgi:hypothetical protein